MPQLNFFHRTPRPWNTGGMIGPKPPLKPKHIWAIRHRLNLGHPGALSVIVALVVLAVLGLQTGLFNPRSRGGPPTKPRLSRLSTGRDSPHRVASGRCFRSPSSHCPCLCQRGVCWGSWASMTWR